MTIKLFEPNEHYKLVAEMWEAQNWPIIPLEGLPTTGMITFQDDIPVAAGFLYNTDSSMAWLEFIVGNPDIDYELRGQGLDLVIQGLTKVAKNMNKKMIFTVSNHKRLIDRYKSFDFKEQDTVTELVRSL